MVAATPAPAAAELLHPGSNLAATRRWYSILVLGVLYLHFLLAGIGSALHGPAWDEVGHLVAGIEHWKRGTYELYRVNPPLPRMFAALPTVLAGHAPLRIETRPPFHGRPEWATGANFVVDNSATIFDLFTWARLACLPFSFLGAIVCLRWGTELSGPGGGLIAMTCWCLGPSMLANAQLITPDLPAAAVGCLAAWLFRGWLKSPSWSSAFLAGVALGGALLTKMTWLLLLALWPMMWLLLRRLFTPRSSGIAAEGRQLAFLLVIGIYVLNAGYGFDGTFRRLGEFEFLSSPLRGEPTGEWEGFQVGNAFRDTPLASVPVPFPAPYVRGIDFQRREFDAGYWSYLLGTHRQGGWWQYYLLSLLWKVPIGFWLMGVAATCAWWHARSRVQLGEALLLIMPAAAVLLLVSSHTGFTHHFRYVLPVLPFGFIWAGKAVDAYRRGYSLATVVGGCGLAWGVLSSVCAFPNSLAYFNGFVGGSRNAHHYMGMGPMDSNLEWGQDLLRLADWTRNSPFVPQLDGVAFGGLGEIRAAAGIPPSWPPEGRIPEGSAPADLCRTGPVPGWYAVGVKDVFNESSNFNYFQHIEPFTVIGHTIYVYRVTEKQADDVWESLHGGKRKQCAWRMSSADDAVEPRKQHPETSED